MLSELDVTRLLKACSWETLMQLQARPEFTFDGLRLRVMVEHEVKRRLVRLSADAIGGLRFTQGENHDGCR